MSFGVSLPNDQPSFLILGYSYGDGKCTLVASRNLYSISINYEGGMGSISPIEMNFAVIKPIMVTGDSFEEAFQKLYEEENK